MVSNLESNGAEDRLTTIGLLFESAAGLRRLFHSQFDVSGNVASQSFDILIRLARSDDGELRMSELAAQASLTPSGLTRAVDRIQDQGLVSRRICPEDRRGSFARLTPAGRELMDAAIPDHVAHIDGILDQLFTTEEEVQLTAMLRKLRDYALEQNGTAGCSTGDDTAPCPGD